MEADNVNHPAHYTVGFSTKVECIDITRHLPFTLGNAFKYVWRAGKKGDSLEKALEDLDKASWYLDEWQMQIAEGDRHFAPGLSAARAVFATLVEPEDKAELLRYQTLAWMLDSEDRTYEAQDGVWSFKELLREKSDVEREA